MAYFTRERMELLISSLCDANERFVNGATADRGADLRVLIECQQKALVLGEYIESLGMKYDGLVSKFSEYCNMIFQIAENLDNTELVVNNYNKINAILYKILVEIDNKIVEISSIDIFDFSNLVTTQKESILVRNEIDRLIDQCLESESWNISDEYSRNLVVGTY